SSHLNRILSRKLRPIAKESVVYGIDSRKDLRLINPESTEIVIRCCPRHNETIASPKKLSLQEFDQRTVATRVLCMALRPKQERDMATSGPEQCLPSGRVIVPPTQNCIWLNVLQSSAHPSIQENMIFADPLSPGRQHLKRKPNLLFVHVPLAKNRVC